MAARSPVGLSSTKGGVRQELFPLCGWMHVLLLGKGNFLLITVTVTVTVTVMVTTRIDWNAIGGLHTVCACMQLLQGWKRVKTS